jgi:indole-3-pyruvate monooxygenase
MDQNVDVIVIGAGFCGLSAAAALKAYNVKDFIVLEGGKSCGDFWDRGHDQLQMHTPWFV